MDVVYKTGDVQVSRWSKKASNVAVCKVGEGPWRTFRSASAWLHYSRKTWGYKHRGVIQFYNIQKKAFMYRLVFRETVVSVVSYSSYLQRFEHCFPAKRF